MRNRRWIGAIGASAFLIASVTGVTVARAASSDGTTVRINAGGGAFTDVNGHAWSADEYFEGGSTNTSAHVVAHTSNEPLYHDERWGMTAYRIPVKPAQYAVILRFAEINPTSGERVQTVKAEGQTIIRDLDTKATIGPFAAELVTVQHVNVTDGTLDLEFVASRNSTSVSAIEVFPTGAADAGAGRPAMTMKPLVPAEDNGAESSRRGATLSAAVEQAPTTTTIKASDTVSAAGAPGAAAPSTASPSGVAMPNGDLPGWKQIFKDDFTTNAAVGSFPGSAYGSKWSVYDDGWKDTAGKNSGGNGRYYASKVVSVSNGVLNENLHSENGIAMVAALMPTLPNYGQTYGRYDIRFRSDAVKGYKTAWLLWPDSENWSDGEIDFPEGDLDQTISAFSHCVGNPTDNCFAAESGVTYTGWHTATVEWTPGKVQYFLDGKSLGSATQSVPRTSMHWVIQTETAGGSPAASAKGDLQIDWVSVYSYAG